MESSVRGMNMESVQDSRSSLQQEYSTMTEGYQPPEFDERDFDEANFIGSDEESEVDYDAPLVPKDAFKLIAMCQDEFMPSTPRKIHALLDEHPEAPKMVITGSGYTALHVACENPSATYDVIERLLKLHKAAVRAQSTFGELPLHCICRNKTAVANEDGDTVLELVLKASPSAASSSDAMGEFPLHWICRNPCATVNMVDEVWKAYPKAAAEVDQYAQTPVDYANKRFKVLSGKFAEEAGLAEATKAAGGSGGGGSGDGGSTTGDSADDEAREKAMREDILQKRYEDGGQRLRVQNEQVLDEDGKEKLVEKTVCKSCGEPGHVERDCQKPKRGKR